MIKWNKRYNWNVCQSNSKGRESLIQRPNSWADLTYYKYTQRAQSKINLFLSTNITYAISSMTQSKAIFCKHINIYFLAGFLKLPFLSLWALIMVWSVIVLLKEVLYHFSLLFLHAKCGKRGCTFKSINNQFTPQTQTILIPLYLHLFRSVLFYPLIITPGYDLPA